MRPECSHILPNGKKCCGLALRGRNRCLHHIAPGQRPPARPPRDPFSRIARWRELGRHLNHLPAVEIPFSVYIILASLLHDGNDGISDREAGRLLRALLRRHGSIPFAPPPGIMVEDAPPRNPPAPHRPEITGSLPAPSS